MNWFLYGKKITSRLVIQIVPTFHPTLDFNPFYHHQFKSNHLDFCVILACKMSTSNPSSPLAKRPKIAHDTGKSTSIQDVHTALSVCALLLNNY